MKSLIDGDIVCYRVGYTTNDDPLGVAIYRTNTMIDGILEETQASDYQIYLSDQEENWREQIFPEYKKNRTAPRPIWLNDLREHLIVNWNAQIAIGQEADDALGIEQNKRLIRGTFYENDDDPLTYSFQEEGKESIICSYDKDLLQIPGNHYSIVTRKQIFVEYYEGLRHFYCQLLIGDISDNIEGVRGIGPVKADKLLDYGLNEKEMFKIVRELYKDDDRLLRTGRVLKIKQKEDEQLWQFPMVTELPQQSPESP